MTSNSYVSQLWFRQNDTFDPSVASLGDGSTGFIAVHTEGQITETSEPDHQATDRQTGDAAPTPKEPGGKLVKLAFSIPLVGLDLTPAIGAAPAAALNATAMLMRNMIGAEVDTTTRAITAGSTTSVTTGANNDNAETLAMLRATANERSRWASLAAGSAGAHNLVPTLDAAITAGEKHGTRAFQVPANPRQTGNYIHAVVNRAGIIRLYSGLRVTSAKITPQGGRGNVLLQVEMIGLRRQKTSAFTALPAHVEHPGYIQARGCRFVAGAVAFETSNFELDLGPVTVTEISQAGDEGIAGFFVHRFTPTFSVDAKYLAATEDDFEAATRRVALLAQFGRGVVSNSRANSIGFFSEGAQYVGLTEKDDGGIIRQAVQFAINTPEYPTRFAGARRGFHFVIAQG